MCYNAQYLTQKLERYAKRFKADTEKLEGLSPRYYASAFSRGSVPCITNYKPDQFQAFSWGLVPSWVKNEEDAKNLSSKTANAKGETIFQKPSFKRAAANHRCIVVLDAFYEYHHHTSRVKIPYRIALEDNQPMAVAGLWSTWMNPTSEELENSLTIITTEANPLMAKIHNNPAVIKRNGSARMPAILGEEQIELWLSDGFEEKDMQHILPSYPESELQYRTVNKLGKHGTGNTPEAPEYFQYQLEGLV